MHVERLNRRHDRSSFGCGKEELDSWFHHHAGQAESRSGSARTYVLVHENRIMGFYSLAASGVAADETPEDLLRGQPRYPVIPAVLLARLAIDASHHGEGLGERLMADAVRRVIAATDHVAVVLLVVDALDDSAAAFYERYGFRRARGDGRTRLLARVKDLRQTFGA
ncbi:MAG TPA: GNAT family N-acetyltransferase [Nitriliruptorales bacterium]